jgi:hypothetical protein
MCRLFGGNCYIYPHCWRISQTSKVMFGSLNKGRMKHHFSIVKTNSKPSSRDNFLHHEPIFVSLVRNSVLYIIKTLTSTCIKAFRWKNPDWKESYDMFKNSWDQNLLWIRIDLSKRKNNVSVTPLLIRNNIIYSIGDYNQRWFMTLYVI